MFSNQWYRKKNDRNGSLSKISSMTSVRSFKTLAYLFMVLMLSGLILGIIAWYSPSQKISLFILTNDSGDSRNPYWSLTKGNIKALRESEIFSQNIILNRAIMKTKKRIEESEIANLIYVDGNAVIDKEGDILFSEQSNRFVDLDSVDRLSDLIKWIDNNLKKNTILVLNIYEGHSQFISTRYSNALKEAASNQIKSMKKKNITLIMPNSTNNPDFPIPGKNVGLLVHFLIQGLKGSADPFSGFNDGRITSTGLTDYIRVRISNWCNHFGYDYSDIFVSSNMQESFLIQYSSKSENEDYGLPDKLSEFPDWLVYAWSIIDNWKSEERYVYLPTLYDDLENKIQETEDLWRIGFDPKTLKENLLAVIEESEAIYQRNSLIFSFESTSFHSFMQSTKDRNLVLSESRVFNSKLKNILKELDKGSLTLKQRSAIISEFCNQWLSRKSKSDNIYTESAIIIQASIDNKWTNLSEINLIYECIQRISDSIMIESELICHIGRLITEKPDLNRPDLYYEFFQSRCIREEIFANPETWPNVIGLYQEIFLNHHHLELTLIYGGQTNYDEFLKEIQQCNQKLNSILVNIETVRDVRKSFSLSLQDLYWLPYILQLIPERQAQVFEYLNNIILLADQMSMFDQVNVTNPLNHDQSMSISNFHIQSEIRRLELLSDRLISSRTNLLFFFDDSLLSIFRSELTQSTEGVKVHLGDLSSILSLPYLSPSTRSELWRLLRNYLSEKSKDTSVFSSTSNIPFDDVSMVTNRIMDSTNYIQRETDQFLKFIRIVAPNAIEASSNTLSEPKDKNNSSTPDPNTLWYNWQDPDFRKSSYLKIIKDTPGFSQLLERLFNDDDFIEQKVNDIRELRLERLKPFFNDLSKFRDYVASDFKSDNFSEQIAELARSLSGQHKSHSPFIKTNILEIRVINEELKLGQIKVEIDLLFNSQTLGNEPVLQLDTSRYLSLHIRNLSDRILKSETSQDGLRFLKIEKVIEFQDFPDTSLNHQIDSLNIDQDYVIPLLVKTQNWTFHHFIPTTILWENIKPKLFYSLNAKYLNEFRHIRLRPASKINPIYLRIYNSSNSSRNYRVRFTFKRLSDDIDYYLESDFVSVPSHSSSPIRLKMTSDGNPPPNSNLKPDENPKDTNSKQVPWPGSQIAVSNQYQVDIFDQNYSNSDPIVSEIKTMEFMTPREYLNVLPPVYSSNSKHLSIRFSGEANISDYSPSPVNLIIENKMDQRGKNVLKIGGNLSALTDFNSSGLAQITAKPVEVRLVDSGFNSRFYLNVDNYERAFMYQNRWVTDLNSEIRPSVVSYPEIHIQVPESAGTNLPVPIKIQPVNEPSDAFVILDIFKSNDQLFKPEELMRTIRLESSRKSEYAIGFDQKSGSLLVNTNFGDWTYELPTSGLVGKVGVKARLVNSSGLTIAETRKFLLIDDQQPQNNAILKFPEFARSGSFIDFLFVCTPPESGISEVFAFIGEVKDGKLPEGQIPIKLQLVQEPHNGPDSGLIQNSNQQYWTGRIRIPENQNTQVVSQLTVQAKSGSGVTITLQKPFQTVKADFVELGAISGTVLLGDRSQPSLPVVLRKLDKNRTEVQRTTTNSQGQFAISSVPPGDYGIFTARSIDQTSAQAEVHVDSGKETQLNLILGRVNLPSNGPVPQEKNNASETQK